MATQDNFILEFLDDKTVAALPDFINNNDNYASSADLIAIAFGADSAFTSSSSDDLDKLVTSFKNNLTLLIQKTWVEKSDIALKDQLLYKLDQLLKENKEWNANYSLFREIIDQAVFLMFGQPTDSPEFCEFSLKIDPMFGIFWWYISSLPKKPDWSEEKFRTAMSVGMYFLANY